MPQAIFAYHLGMDAEQYAFFRIPKLLITEPYFRWLSTDAKLLYGLMLDRMSLSMRNGWMDDDGHVYIYFTLEEACEQLCCKTDKAVKLFAELDSAKGVGLIRRVKQGLGRPAKIYVLRFMGMEDEPGEDTPKAEPPSCRNPDFGKTEVKSSEKPKSEPRKIRSQDLGKTECNKTDKNNTEFFETHFTTERSIEPVKTIALANQKGGVGKTTTAASLGIGLSRQSATQIQRYVRLNLLIPPLVEAVDKGFLKLAPAADFLSHLSEKEQTYLLLVMERDEVSPSLGQAQRLKQLSSEGKLENNIIDLIMREEKPLERKVTIRNDRLQKYFPASYTPKQMEDVIIKLLEGWHRKRQQEQVR